MHYFKSEHLKLNKKRRNMLPQTLLVHVQLEFSRFISSLNMSMFIFMRSADANSSLCFFCFALFASFNYAECTNTCELEEVCNFFLHCKSNVNKQMKAFALFYFRLCYWVEIKSIKNHALIAINTLFSLD